jgi:hypothetical protein
MSAVGVAGKYFMLLLLGGPQSVHSTAASAAVRCDFGTNEHAITSPSAPTRAAAMAATVFFDPPPVLRIKTRDKHFCSKILLSLKYGSEKF